MEDQKLEFDLRNVLAVLRRQLRLIFSIVALVVALALAYVFSATPLYRAEALILVDPSEQNLLEPGQVNSTQAAVLNSRVESEVEILKSAAMAQAMVQAADLVTDPEFGPSLSTRAKLLQAIGIQPPELPDGDALLKNVITAFSEARDVRRRGLTFVIAVSVTSESPDRAAFLANTLAETYISRQVEAKVNSALAGRNVLQGQIATAQTRLALTSERLDNFIFDNLDRLEAESDDGAITALRAQLASTQSLQAARAALSADAQGALEEGNWSTLSTTLQDQVLVELERQRLELERRLGDAEEGQSLAVDLQAALDEVEANLQAQASQRVVALQGEVQELEDQIGNVRDDIRNTLLRSDLSSNTLAEVFTLQQEAELSRNQYTTLLSRLSDLETLASVQIADSRIVSEALPPTRPSSPNKRLTLAIALVGATGLGIALAFANEYYVGGVTSESQLANLVQGPVAGSVPNFELPRGLTSVADCIVDQPLSPYGEAFRQIRARIDQTLKKRGGEPGRGRVILVTSAVPADGKSTTALSLARTYAISGVKTVLVDADLRKPALARQMGVTPNSSLLQYLSVSDPKELQLPLFSKDPKSTLNAVLGDARSEIPTDQLVVSERFRAMLDVAREHASVVIVDSPPVLPVVDARYIADQADLIMFVSRFASTTQRDIRYAMDQIKSSLTADVPIISMLSHEEQRERFQRYKGYYADYTS